MIIDKRTYKEYCHADMLANSSLKRSTFYSKFKRLLFPDHIERFLKLLRKTEYIYNCKSDILGSILYVYYLYRYRKLSFRLGFSIPLNVFGPGLSIPHYGTIVVNPATKVGKNCRLHVGVNIGASGGSSLAPKIGDNVYIGPGAIIFGDITLYDNITIAANATVNESVKFHNVTIGGTPAKILRENTSMWWQKNRLNLQS